MVAMIPQDVVLENYIVNELPSEEFMEIVMFVLQSIEEKTGGN